jgi:FHS family L-fucose permease-like MFS transporter
MQVLHKASFLVLISVFFFWGFVAASNSILIPVNLTQTQAMLVDVCFYVAYTVGSLLYLLCAKLFNFNILQRIGYKNGIALGLCISAAGTLLFIPAANLSSFSLMLAGLFVVGLGFSLQQTAANPLVIRMGDPDQGAQRLSLAGGINNIGTTIAPLLLSIAIFGSIQSRSSNLNLTAIQWPYLILGMAFVLVALFFYFSNLPDHINTEHSETHTQYGFLKLITIPQVGWGMLAIFLYVGVEVATAANLPEYMKRELHIPTAQVAPYVSLFWASLMIGRWTGAAGAFNFKFQVTSILRWILPYVAFLIFIVCNAITSDSIQWVFPYFFVIPILIFTDWMSKGKPERQLVLFSIFGIMALCFGMVLHGLWSAFAITAVGLFCSTLWPCIFTIAIRNMKVHTHTISSYLIMMIMGGGWISLLQGTLADGLLGIRYSFIVGILCFLFLAWYGWKSHKWTHQNQIQ